MLKCTQADVFVVFIQPPFLEGMFGVLLNILISTQFILKYQFRFSFGIGGDYKISKRQDTIALENALIKQIREKKVYGCKEITIGFYNNGHGNEVVDFMTMDSKGIIKCYELKVTLQDLKSTAKKSWYGHYNYLVVNKELYERIVDWNEYIPNNIGIIVGECLESKRKAKRCDISSETEIMLKESMIRSMFWKMQKYKDSQSLDKERQLQSKIRRLEREKDNAYDRALKAERIISDYETYKWYNERVDIDLAAMAKAEKEKYRERREKMKDWILIDYDFREKLPKYDCEIWITRIFYTGERWVQKVDFYADTQDIEWDGTIAFMIADKNDAEPDFFDGKYITTIQNVR